MSWFYYLSHGVAAGLLGFVLGEALGLTSFGTGIVSACLYVLTTD